MLAIKEPDAQASSTNKRQKVDKSGGPSSLLSVVEYIQDVLPPRNLTETLTLPLTLSEQARLWEAITTTWRNLKHKHAPIDEMKDTMAVESVLAKKLNDVGDINGSLDEAGAQINEELTLDDWEDGSAEDDPLYCAQKRDAQTIVDWVRQVCRVAPNMPLSQMLSEADDNILDDRFCLIRTALTEIELTHKHIEITPHLVEEAEIVWRVILTKWDDDASIAGIGDMIDMGLASWFDVKKSRFDPLYHIASTRCISRDVQPSDKRKLMTLARERSIDSGYYLIACKIFDMAIRCASLELDKLLVHHKGCWLYILNVTFSDWRTIWTVVQRHEDFEQLLQIATRTSREINWLQLMSIDSLHPTSSKCRPRLGIALHFCNNENVLKCMLEEMESSCLDQAILDAPNLPTYIAQQVCPFFLQRMSTCPEVVARIVLWIEGYVESHLNADARVAFAALQFTPQQQEKIDTLRHFLKHADSCLVCMEETLDRAACGHTIHVASCLVKLENAVCPYCRDDLVVGGHVEEKHLQQLRTHIETSKARRLTAWQNEMLRLQELYNDMLPPDVLHDLAVRHNV
jgi:hypothetical protein